METPKKSIDTLVKDIEGVLLNGADDFNKEKASKFGMLVAETIFRRLNETKKEFTLRMSNIGYPCARKLWLDKWRPEGKEPLRASTKLKFLIGDVWELVLLFLADLAGHEVKDQQKERNLYGIKGHSDATIDGHLVDSKSASSYSFKKFKSHLGREEDSFGYLGQLGGYHKSATDDPEVLDKEQASFLVVDKQHGHLALDTHEFKHDEIDWEKFVQERKDLLELDNPPERAYNDVEDGYKHKDTKQFIPNGSKKLDTVCSYCDQKFNCWPELRILVGSRGPVYYTKLQHKFKMKEISRKELESGETEEDDTGGEKAES